MKIYLLIFKISYFKSLRPRHTGSYLRKFRASKKLRHFHYSTNWRLGGIRGKFTIVMIVVNSNQQFPLLDAIRDYNTSRSAKHDGKCSVCLYLNILGFS